MDFEAKHRVAWGTRSVQIEKSKENADIGSYREERSLKVKGVWVLGKGRVWGVVSGMEWRALNLGQW